MGRKEKVCKGRPNGNIEMAMALQREARQNDNANQDSMRTAALAEKLVSEKCKLKLLCQKTGKTQDRIFV